MNSNSDVNIAAAEFKADPFPFYRRLRTEAPVCRVTLPDRQMAWLVTRYDDVVAVLKDERFAKNPFRVLSKEQLATSPWLVKLLRPLFMPLAQTMLNLDPPDHTRLRALVQQAFSPRLVEGMRGRIETLPMNSLIGLLSGEGWTSSLTTRCRSQLRLSPRCWGCRSKIATGFIAGRAPCCRPTPRASVSCGRHRAFFTLCGTFAGSLPSGEPI